MVGNKSDLNQTRKITKEEARVLAASENLFYIETSAKTGQNVEKCFKMVIDQILIKIENGIIDVDKEEGIRKKVQTDSKALTEKTEMKKVKKCLC